MNLPHPDHCYQALMSRDTRFDGRIFVGVSSTRIYCRPVCRVRTPRRENCHFFASAAAAEQAGYRPCLRCCPERAPGVAPIESAARLAVAAAQLLEDSCGDAARPPAVAARLGISERHLRRIFTDQFGVTPSAYLGSRRLQLARRMLAESDLPIGEVALAAGFGSLRTFNQRFRARYGVAPGTLRRSRPGEGAGMTLRLGFRPPLDWSALCAFLQRRAIPGVEWVETDARGPAYRRVVRLAGHVGWVAATLAEDGYSLAITVDPALVPVAPAVLGRMRRLFDLSCDPLEVARALGALAERRPGLRVPGAANGFEMAVRAILGQQISVIAARTLAARFAQRFGEPVATPWAELTHDFPEPARIAALEVGALTALGVMGPRAAALIGLAQAIDRGVLWLDSCAPLESSRAALLAIRGIGPWTADYIAMRALGWPDAFPEGDVGVHKALGETARKSVRERMEAFRPWRAYAVMHLWMSLEESE